MARYGLSCVAAVECTRAFFAGSGVSRSITNFPPSTTAESESGFSASQLLFCSRDPALVITRQFTTAVTTAAAPV
jgi:hypothetical protein